MVYNIDDMPLTAGDVKRSYRHRPNSGLNAILTTLTLLTLAAALGIGFGHYLGSQREGVLRRQQESRLKDVQDDLLICFRQRDSAIAQYTEYPSSKLDAVTRVWKQKYQELIVEKVELEQRLVELQQQRTQDQQVARLQEEQLSEEAAAVAGELAALKVVHSTSLVEAEEERLRHQAQVEASDLQLMKKSDEYLSQAKQLGTLAEQKKTQEELLQTKEQQLQTEELQLQTQEKQMQSKEQQLQTQEQELQSQKQQLQIKEEQLQAQEQQLLTQEQQLQSQNKELQIKEEQLQTQEQQIRTQEQQLQTHGQQLNTQEQQLMAQLQELEELSAAAVCENTERDASISRAELESLRSQVLERYQPATEQPEEVLSGGTQKSPGGAEATDDREAVAAGRHVEVVAPEQPHPAEGISLRDVMNQVNGRLPARHPQMDEDVASDQQQPLNVVSMGDVINQASGRLLRPQPQVDEDLRQKPDQPSTDGAPDQEQPVNVVSLGDVINQASGRLLRRQPQVDEDLGQKPDQPSTEAVKTEQNVDAETDEPQMSIVDVDVEGDPSMAALKQRLELLANQVEDEKSRADRWLQLYLEHKKQSAPDVGVVSCLSLLLPDVSRLSHAMPNLTHAWQVLTSLDTVLAEQWTAVRQAYQQQDTPRAVRLFQELEKSLETRLGDLLSRGHQMAAHNEQLQRVVSTTKQTIAQLSEEVSAVWRQVGDMPRTQKAMHTLEKVKVKVTNIKDKLVTKMTKLGKKMSSEWKKVRAKVDNGWFKRQATKSDPDHVQDHFSNSAYGHGEEARGTFTDSLPKGDKKRFEHKPQHKQKQSAEQNYEEFWRRANFDPDDYVHEDFFEGQHREWKKHQQKRFKKIHGRIHRLNEDILHSMDDDDIEDIYEDLEDLDDDINLDGAGQPARLKTWLTCQIRWWKSRFQRKHRREDLLGGCGSHFMTWQLKALCKPTCTPGRKCRQAVPAACQYLQANTVILPACQPANQTQPDGQWFFERAQERDTLRSPHTGWVFSRARDRQNQRDQPWYDRRAEGRRLG